ncbi:LiaF transmembrane domain-containing protein [Massilia endophytica]|uniref:LiaF transmembrane domain-containing protein n=1 Tax=Massilia endophytica TaxID=2899220 RepID=UPI001E388D58|nr:DUF5668 domain-containing protein [Massilia endophytica]UGQ48119.1 cell wall-active antibiotics response protein [Massilia endophytica]
MRTRRERSPAGQILVGLAVIGIGFVFLLDNLGWIDVDVSFQFWPVILMMAGVLKIMQSRSTNGSILGGFLLLFGALLLLKGMGVLYISWRVVAPLAMIGVGLMVVFRSSKRGQGIDASGVSLGKDGEGDTVSAMAILGACQRRSRTANFRGGEVTAMMGGCEIDLRECSMSGEAVVNVFAMMGGITIKVPIDWQVEMEGVPILGGFEDKTVVAKDGGKRLVVRGYAIMGGLEIRN